MENSSKLHSTNTTEPMGELNTCFSSINNTISSTSHNTNLNIISSTTNTSSSSSSRVVRSMDMENMSLEVSKYPRDLFQHFLGGGNRRVDECSKRLGGNLTDDEVDDDDKGLNLGLGLSLGGKFGVDKTHKGLIRSSSIAGTMPLLREDAAAAVAPPQRTVSTLVRTSSLPVETEEEWRKRKETQTLRRMEAKRRRSEKQRGMKEGGGGGSEESMKVRGRGEREKKSVGITSKFIGSSMGNLFGSATPPPPPPSNLEVKGRRSTFGSLQGFLIAQGQVQGQGQQGQQGSSQGSGESQGGGASSGASELESKTHQGSSSCGEARSPSSIHSLQERGSHEAAGSPGSRGDSSQRGEAEGLSKRSEATENKRRDTSSSGIEDMPCVFTIGDGPNGRKVEGILYKYGKGEEVRIMCVCHGNFFTPADFVKHAGGRDVEHPLRHIVVSPPSSAFQ